MVIFYKNDGRIVSIEHNVMTPKLPYNMTPDEKVEHYKGEGLNYMGVPYELGADIFYHRVVFNEQGEFVGLLYDEEIAKEFEGEI